ncbi:MAG: glycosyltransferase family 2 protein [Eubacteriales bacterium]|nr:glycosyltransferase family 2 protein [Eubacteriales bacterium]
MKHTFAISAYGESEYLEDCIRSLKAQTVLSDIIICTSTPNGLITGTAERWGISLYVRSGSGSIGADWNFAVETAVRETGAELVTVAHQDDMYRSEYVQALLEAVGRYPDMSLFCTRCRTVDENGDKLHTRAEGVKRILRLPLRLRALSALSPVKKIPLIIGNGIACPTCTYNIHLTGMPLFGERYRFVVDWDTLLRLADRPGRFICEERELVDYRVHPGAETRKNIIDHNREREERELFLRIWPEPAVRLIMHFYKKAYRDYDADTD